VKAEARERRRQVAAAAALRVEEAATLATTWAAVKAAKAAAKAEREPKVAPVRRVPRVLERWAELLVRRARAGRTAQALVE
jgi:hypothetical protein